MPGIRAGSSSTSRHNLQVMQRMHIKVYFLVSCACVSVYASLQRRQYSVIVDRRALLHANLLHATL